LKILDDDFKFVDLFSGIGGFHYAMKKFSPNAICVKASEINKNAISVYKENFGIDSSADICEIKVEDFEKFDVLCAGFPCQSFSKAGHRKGFSDSRGVLFNQIERIIKDKISINEKPKILILENVKNISTHDNGNTWQIIRNKLENLDYNVVKEPIISSPSDYGIPQKRQRAIILAVDKKIYSDNLDFNIRKTNERKISLDEIFENDSPELKKYDITAKDLDVLNMWDDFIDRIGKKLIGFPIWSFEFGNKDNINHYPLWKQNFILKNRKLYDDNKEKIDVWKEKYKPHLYIKTFQKFEWQVGDDIDSVFEGYIQFRPSGIRVKRPDEVLPTLVAMVHTPIIGNKKRYITPREAARLQSFPENFKFDSVGEDIYRLLGNAVNVEVIFNVFSDFVNFLERKTSYVNKEN